MKLKTVNNTVMFGVCVVIMMFVISSVAHCQWVISVKNTYEPKESKFRVWQGQTFDQGYTLLIQPDPDTPSTAQPPDYSTSAPRYPHAMLMLEASALAMAAVENCRNYAGSEYYDHGVERRRSGTRCAMIWAPASAGAFALGVRLQHSPRKALRIAGHGVVWGTVAAIAVNYFARAR